VLTMDPLIYGRALLTWTPTAANVGSYTAKISATDTGADGLTEPATTDLLFGVTVRAANSAPILDPIGLLEGTENAPLSYTFGASDPDGDALTYTATNLPKGAEFDRATGKLDWTPSPVQSGTFTVGVTVSDGHSASSEDVTIQIAQANRDPVFVPMTAQLGRDRADIRFTVVADDPDGDDLKLSVISGLPEGAAFSEQRGEFSWIPQYDQTGSYTVVFAAQDPNGAEARYAVDIIIADVNRAPVMEVSDRVFLIGEEKSFTLEASDPDGTPLTFSALDLPEGATLDAATGEVSWTPGPGQEGDYYVTFIADDGRDQTRQTIVMRATLEPEKPVVRIELTPSFPAVPGQQVLVQVVADSLSDITGISLYADGNELTLDEFGRTLLTPTRTGKIELAGYAQDADGNIGEQIIDLKVRDPEDRSAPVIFMGEGLNLYQLDGKVDIGGMVEDTNLDFWRLELRSADGTSLIRELASGEEPVGGLLATLDTGTLLNGFYSLRLTAADIGNRYSVKDVRIEVNGTEKPGRFTAVETDVETELGGVPFMLVRRFDSLTGQDRDFGSWSAGYDLDI
ncbi:putative Ig domain-containing protein, partial [Cribrihabitans sp. XS_ASV171]